MSGDDAMTRVTLTFDNGPTAGITERVLDVLAHHDIRSNFFMMGRQLESPKNAALLPAIRAAGHKIGNHTYSHTVPFGERVDADFARDEIDRAQRLLGAFASPEKFFRPYGKHGRLGRHVFSRNSLAYLRDEGYTTITWTAVPGDMFKQDWDLGFEARLAAQNWSVVVLHDIENACLAHLPDFIARLKDGGFELRQDFPESVVVTRAGSLVTANEDLVSDGLPS